MQRKRRADEAFSETQITPSFSGFFNARNLGMTKPSLILCVLKAKVENFLKQKDYVNAVLTCEEIYNLTRPKIDTTQTDLGSVLPETKKIIEDEFNRLTSHYCEDELGDLDYVRYSCLANNIIFLLLTEKKYACLQKLLDEHSLLTVAQLNHYIVNCVDVNVYQTSTDEPEELLQLRNLFRARCSQLFQSQQPSVSAFAYYYLYVLTEKTLYKEDSLNIATTTTDPQCLAYLKLINFLKIYDNLNFDLSWEYIHDDSSEDESETTNHLTRIAALKHRIVSECMPLLANSIALGNPVGFLHIMSDLKLDDQAQVFWAKLGMLHGNIFSGNDCSEYLTQFIFKNIAAAQPECPSVFRRNQLNKSLLLTKLSKQKLLAALQKTACDANLKQCLIALQSLCNHSQQEIADLLAQTKPTLLPGPICSTPLQPR